MLGVRRRGELTDDSPLDFNILVWWLNIALKSCLLSLRSEI